MAISAIRADNFLGRACSEMINEFEKEGIFYTSDLQSTDFMEELY